MVELYLDADACPVREEAYKVADRHGLVVHVVTAGNVRVPWHPLKRLVLVEAGPDAADDWIAERIRPGDICVTSDVPLAARCLKAGGQAVGPTGRRFTPDNIGEALAARELARHLRELGEPGGGQRPLAARDRSRFLDALEQLVQAGKRSA
ncbi:UPF0178 protein [Aliidongia dinghuensis]|uniref:UPF0178 protein GCM10011611_04510 n=1 Tax=Aliidongia dinghuensis TaxID=1867774 RepID=A0A8J3E2X2_9PROT|nr:YaiI/YqxD family protein [Aliidongia dinghuensis]GGF02105.1 UPF0178 protein [Aliidongia dinghuensis]